MGSFPGLFPIRFLRRYGESQIEAVRIMDLTRADIRPEAPPQEWRGWLSALILYCLLPALAIRVLLALFTPADYLSWEAAENYLVRARAVLDGQVPYRDFWDSKPPLWTYTFALWGRAFGVSVLSLKMLIIAAEMACIYLLYLLAFDVRNDRRFALRAAMIYAFLPQVLFVGAVEGKYESLTFLFVLGAFRLLLRGRELLAGILLGIGMAYKFSVALALLPALTFLGNRVIGRLRRWFAMAGAALLTLGVALLPFLLAASQRFFSDTIANFAIGKGHHDIPYKAISVWSVLSRNAGLDAPAAVPLVVQLAFLAFVTWLLLRSQSLQSISSTGYGMMLVTHAFIIMLAFIIFIRVGNIQYFNWSLPFMAILLADLWERRKRLPAARRLLILAPVQTLLVLYTWKNWSGRIAGPLLVIVTLGVSALILIMALRLSLAASTADGSLGSPQSAQQAAEVQT